MYTLLDELHLAYLPVDPQKTVDALPQPPSHWIWAGQPKHQLESHDLGWGLLFTAFVWFTVAVTAFKGLHPLRSYLLRLFQSLPLPGSAWAPLWCCHSSAIAAMSSTCCSSCAGARDRALFPIFQSKTSHS